MNKDFVNYKTALALKELGFDEKCIAADYDANGKIVIQYADEGITNTELDEITAQCNEDAIENGENPIDYDPTVPLYQQAFRWFREKHGLGHMISGIGCETFLVYLINKNGIITIANAKTYEEAEQACLDKLIEIVKKNAHI